MESSGWVKMVKQRCFQTKPSDSQRSFIEFYERTFWIYERSGLIWGIISIPTPNHGGPAGIPGSIKRIPGRSVQTHLFASQYFDSIYNFQFILCNVQTLTSQHFKSKPAVCMWRITIFNTKIDSENINTFEWIYLKNVTQYQI